MLHLQKEASDLEEDVSRASRQWMRVDRDWDSNTKIRRIGMEFGANGVVAWFSLLARACQNDGVIGDDMDLRVAISSPAVNVSQGDIDVIADGFKALGVVATGLAGNWVVANWDEYQPPMNAITPASRKRHAIVTDKSDSSVATDKRTDGQTDGQTSMVIKPETKGSYRSSESVQSVLRRLQS
jgi:hypothetical protein